MVEEAKGKQITNGCTLEWLSELIDDEYQGICSKQSKVVGTSLKKMSTLSVFNPVKRMRIATNNTLSSCPDGADDEIDTLCQKRFELAHRN